MRVYLDLLSHVLEHGTRRDQIRHLLEGLRKDPCSRRHIASAWHPGERDPMALPACHAPSAFRFEDFTLGNDDPQPAIRAPIAV